MRAYHGTTIGKIHSTLAGTSSRFSGLYVTDTLERAQLYADAQASRMVETDVRRVSGSAVMALEVPETRWMHRENSTSLDVVEAVVDEWQIINVTVYATGYQVRKALVKIDGRYVNPFEFLKERLGDKLTVIIN